MRYKKDSWGARSLLLETATLWETRVLRCSGTTLRSCAVNCIVPVPVTGLGTRDPMIPLNSTLQTLSVKSCVNGVCFSAFGAMTGHESSFRLWPLVSPAISAVPRPIVCPPLVL